MRELADAGAAILFYTTDYDELIGCCDRVLILYDGADRARARGRRITEHAHRRQRLNITTPVAEAAAHRLTAVLGRNLGLSLAILLFLVFYGVYNACTRKGFTRGGADPEQRTRAWPWLWWPWPRPCRCSPAGSTSRSAP